MPKGFPSPDSPAHCVGLGDPVLLSIDLSGRRDASQTKYTFTVTIASQGSIHGYRSLLQFLTDTTPMSLWGATICRAVLVPRRCSTPLPRRNSGESPGRDRCGARLRHRRQLQSTMAPNSVSAVAQFVKHEVQWGRGWRGPPAGQ